MAGNFYTGELGVLAEVSVTEQDLREISKFPEILGKVSMRSVYQALSSPPTHESLGTRLGSNMLPACIIATSASAKLSGVDHCESFVEVVYSFPGSYV